MWWQMMARQIGSFLVVLSIFVGYDFFFLDKEVEYSIDYGSVDAEDLGSFIAFDDALLDWLPDDGLLYDHVLLVVYVESLA